LSHGARDPSDYTAGNATRNAAHYTAIEKCTSIELLRYQWVGRDLHYLVYGSRVENFPGLHLEGKIEIVPGIELLTDAALRMAAETPIAIQETDSSEAATWIRPAGPAVQLTLF
jgi:hypothetical protein